MKLTTALDADELAQLAAQWGAAPVAHTSLPVGDPFLTGEHQLLTSAGRRAEICYIMHCGDPAAGVLLHIKTFYPAGAFRLPTGGIHVQEAVMETLGREIFEETGMQVGVGSDQVQVERFLGVLGYDFQHSVLGSVAFATYHFLVRMPVDGVLAPQDEDESIGGWEWVPAAELDAVADRLESVHLRSAVWADWGRYRALSHRFVAEALR